MRLGGGVPQRAAEIAGELSEAGVENVFDPNLGGTVTFDWGWVKVVPAWHTSTTPPPGANDAGSKSA